MNAFINLKYWPKIILLIMVICAANYIIHVIAEDDCQIYYMCLNFVSQDVCKEIAPGLNNT